MTETTHLPETKAAKELLSNLSPVTFDVQVDTPLSGLSPQQEKDWLEEAIVKATEAWQGFVRGTKQTLDTAIAFGGWLSRIDDACVHGAGNFRAALKRVAPIKYNQGRNYIRLFKRQEDLSQLLTAMPEGERVYWQTPTNAVRLLARNATRKRPKKWTPALTPKVQKRLTSLMAKHNVQASVEDVLAFLKALRVNRQQWKMLGG